MRGVPQGGVVDLGTLPDMFSRWGGNDSTNNTINVNGNSKVDKECFNHYPYLIRYG